MEFNLSNALNQGRRVNDIAADIRGSKNSLNTVKGSLESSWKATEVTYINHHFDNLTTELSRLATELDSIGHDIQSTANEIHREIEEKKAAEAKAKAEAEAKAKAEAEAKAEAAAKAKANP
ncbi:hypothetical protein [Neobacillus vireti]|uniref:WXG100 family type VII secretion target n=1 Tax=Neobacillus vireti LMG 21834 TaxID=1131730 RepID=A0AB94IMR5_9BACI|nr:hypothetical protein [Neobacillus vireti]ETI68365.1 hypothetical protein BAVI_12879 [Neobacillus vireti LMG 21834]KLT16319.1 hypothetical protein AA980_17630 [Neobacillus vireti]